MAAVETETTMAVAIVLESAMKHLFLQMITLNVMKGGLYVFFPPGDKPQS